MNKDARRKKTWKGRRGKEEKKRKKQRRTGAGKLEMKYK